MKIISRLSHIFFVLYLIALPTSMALMELCSWTLFLLMSIRFFLSSTEERKLALLSPNKLLDKALFIYFLIFFLSCIFNAKVPWTYRWESIGEARWILLLYAFVYFWRTEKPPLKPYLYTVISILTIVSIYSWVQTFTGLNYFKTEAYIPTIKSHFGMLWRSKGFFTNTMTFSYIVGQYFFIAMGLFSFRWFKEKKFLSWELLFFVVLLTTVVSTFTRGLWVAVLGASLFGLFYFRQWGFMKWAGAMSGAAALIVSQIPLLKQRFLSIFNITMPSNLHRIHLWQANWEMFLDYPLVGVGFRMNKVAVETYYQKLGIENGFVGQAHNVYMQLLAGSGIGVLLSYLYLIWTFFREVTGRYKVALKNSDNFFAYFCMGVLLAEVCFHGASMTENVYLDGEVWHNFIFLLSCVLGYTQTSLVEKHVC